MMVLNSVDLAVTSRCNLCCAFCYATKNRTCETRDEEVARNLRAAAWIVAQCRQGPPPPAPQPQRVELCLYGGEPTVAWESVLALWEFSRTCGIRLDLNVVTNMVLMDEARIDWCLASGVGISPSIDGCAPAQDFFRVNECGQGSSATVFQHAKILTAKLRGGSCRSTVAPETVQWMAESVRFICEGLGFKENNQVLAGGVQWSAAALGVVRAQLRQITDWWIDNMRRGVHYGLFHLKRNLPGIWTPLRKRNSLCRFGRGHIAIDLNGDIYPCHRFCNPETDPAYKLGNIDAGGVTNHALEKRLREFNPAVGMKDQCASCPAVNSCSGFCLHEAMVDGQAIFTPPRHHCDTFRLFHAEALRAHSILSAEQNKLYLDIYRPRPQRPGLVPLSPGPKRAVQRTASPRTVILRARQPS
jgi:uncharacterized protein